MALGKVGKGVIATLATVTLVGGVFAGVYHFVPDVKEKVDNTVENLINKIKDKFQGDSGNNNNQNNNVANPEIKDKAEKIQNDIKKPEDIIVPEDATEEEKEALSEEMAYWSIVQRIKDCINMSNGEYGNSFVKLNNIYSTENANELFVCANVLGSDFSYYTADEIYRIQFENDLDFSDVEALSESMNSSILSCESRILMKDLKNSKEICENLYNSIANKTTDECSLLYSGIMSNMIEEYYSSGLVLKQTDQFGESIKFIEVQYSMIGLDKNSDELLDYFNKNEIHVTSKVKGIASQTNINWEQLYSKYSEVNKTQSTESGAEAESVAVEECTERDSEGNVVGFDWNAYLQKNASSHSKVDLDNSQSPSSPIRYADLELSL